MSDHPLCATCVRKQENYNTREVSCKCHMFFPRRPETMPRSNCSGFEYDERKEVGNA